METIALYNLVSISDHCIHCCIETITTESLFVIQRNHTKSQQTLAPITPYESLNKSKEILTQTQTHTHII